MVVKKDNEYCLIYQRKCRVVAWVDLVVSSICFVMYWFMLIKFFEGRVVGGILLWARRGILEIVSIFLAVKLLQSCNAENIRNTPTLAEKWCIGWMFGCGTWIFFVFVDIGLKVMEPVKAESYHVDVVTLVLTIFIRLGAFYIVFRYWKELSFQRSEELHDFTA